MYLRRVSYTESDRLADELYRQPDLAEQIEQLSKRLRTEQERRLEYYDWLDEDKKAEFINGEIFVHSPVVKRHADATKLLTQLLDTFARIYDLGYVASEKILVQLKRNDFEPDVSFWRKPKAEAFEEDQLFFPAPDLVVEVLSPSTERNNRTVKYDSYAAAGVEEYWIVDAKKQIIERFLLQDGRYVAVEAVDARGVLASAVVEGFRVDAVAIFDSKASLRALREMFSGKP